MSDIWLCWFGVEEKAVHATPEQVRTISADLGLDAGVPERDEKALAFRQACRTVTAYRGEQKQSWQLRARVARSGEFLVARVERSDGLKMAELKLFSAAVQRPGIPRGTGVLAQAVRTRLSEIDKAGVMDWLSKTREVYERLGSHVPSHAVRYAARMNLLTVGVPILRHNQMFFGYSEGAPEARRVEQFLAATSSGYDFTLLPLAAGADVTKLALSADAYLYEQLEDPLYRLARAAQPAAHTMRVEAYRSISQLIPRVRLQALTHQRRLRSPMPRTMTALAQCEQLMSDVPRPAEVPTPRRKSSSEV